MNANQKNNNEAKAKASDGTEPLKCPHCETVKFVNFASFAQKPPTGTEVRKVIVKFNGTPCCEYETESYLKKMASVYECKEQFITLYDARNVGMLGTDTIKQQASFMRKKDSLTRKYMRRCAIIVNGVVARQLVNGLFTLKAPACDLECFDTPVEAQAYLKVVSSK